VVIAGVCDLVSLIGGSSHGWANTWFRGGSYALIVGTGALLLAAVAGFLDRARHTDAGSRQRAAVGKHAAVMTLTGVVCLVDLLLRLGHYVSAQHTPAVVLSLTFVAVALAAVGGEIGGRLVYRGGVGVRSRRAATVRAGDAPAITGGPTDQRPASSRGR
jgi:uncharacterized membrane protein